MKKFLFFAILSLTIAGCTTDEQPDISQSLTAKDDPVHNPAPMAPVVQDNPVQNGFWPCSGSGLFGYGGSGTTWYTNGTLYIKYRWSYSSPFYPSFGTYTGSGLGAFGVYFYESSYVSGCGM